MKSHVTFWENLVLKVDHMPQAVVSKQPPKLNLIFGTSTVLKLDTSANLKRMQFAFNLLHGLCKWGFT